MWAKVINSLLIYSQSHLSDACRSSAVVPSLLLKYVFAKTSTSLILFSPTRFFCSAVRPKAGGGATAGAWTNMGSLCLASMTGTGVRRSATTWRTNERMDGERRAGNKGGWCGAVDRETVRERANCCCMCFCVNIWRGSGPLLLGLVSVRESVRENKGEGEQPSLLSFTVVCPVLREPLSFLWKSKLAWERRGNKERILPESALLF